METMEEEANEADQNLADSNCRTMAGASTTIKSKFMINDILDGGEDEEENEVEAAAAETPSSTFLPAMTALALANFHNQTHHHLYSRPSVVFLPTFHHLHNNNRKSPEDSCSNVVGVTKEDHCDNSLHGDPSPSSGI